MAIALGAFGQTNVVTYHNDTAHTGQYRTESLLTPANVNHTQFGRRDFFTTDGGVYAQPLYLSRVKIPGKGLRNVVYVATAHDSVYAFDADDPGAAPLWMISFLNAATGVTTATKDDTGCVVLPEMGIIGTPVIDAAAGTIYLIAETKESGTNFVFRLHALDVTTGAERAHSPVQIAAEGFVPLAHKQRASLLLSNGVVYSTWSGNCDNGTYHGFVMAHDATTLKMLGLFNAAPVGTGASFWNGGGGPVTDSQGNLYVVSANGDVNGVPDPGGYDEAVIKLAPTASPKLLDSFTPFNRDILNVKDYDLGSSGAVLLPDSAGSAAHRHLLMTSGKEGRIYLLDRDALGGAQTGTDASALASLPYFSGHATFGSSAFFNGAIYVAPEHSPVYKFPVANASLASKPSAESYDEISALGASPSISSNGDTNGIVWVCVFNQGGELFAFDAGDLRTLYDSRAEADDPHFTFTEFTAVTIADGRVYVPNYFGVAVYGELSTAAPAISAVVDAADFSNDLMAPGSLISIFGANLATATALNSVVPLPMSMDDVSVTVNGIRAPLLYVSPGQINVQVPYEVPPGQVSLSVLAQGKRSESVTITLKPAAPALFTDTKGHAAAVNPDGSANSTNSPAAPGTYVSLYFTGQGPVSQLIDDGDAPAPGAIVSATSAVSATIGGVAADVQFAGLAPYFPGVAQINLKVPPLDSGVYPVVVNIAGVSSNIAQVAVSGN